MKHESIIATAPSAGPSTPQQLSTQEQTLAPIPSFTPLSYRQSIDMQDDDSTDMSISITPFKQAQQNVMDLTPMHPSSSKSATATANTNTTTAAYLNQAPPTPSLTSLLRSEGLQYGDSFSFNGDDLTSSMKSPSVTALLRRDIDLATHSSIVTTPSTPSLTHDSADLLTPSLTRLVRIDLNAANDRAPALSSLATFSKPPSSPSNEATANNVVERENQTAEFNASSEISINSTMDMDLTGPLIVADSGNNNNNNNNNDNNIRASIDRQSLDMDLTGTFKLQQLKQQLQSNAGITPMKFPQHIVTLSPPLNTASTPNVNELLDLDVVPQDMMDETSSSSLQLTDLLRNRDATDEIPTMPSLLIAPPTVTNVSSGANTTAANIVAANTTASTIVATDDNVNVNDSVQFSDFSYIADLRFLSNAAIQNDNSNIGSRSNLLSIEPSAVPWSFERSLEFSSIGNIHIDNFKQVSSR
jgi:hypothetical protein